VAIPLLSRILRVVSLFICVIAVGWFVGFAVEQSKTASAHQQAELNGSAPASQRTASGGAQTTPAKQGGLRKAIDDAFSTISSPFSGLTSGLSSQWTLHIVDTLLALLIYGFGLGFLARLVRFGS
jgi:uncharacterized membrane protein YraQ (UPF0718 family)